MKNYNFSVDEDTMIVLNIISRFLKKYFKYQSDDDVIDAVNNFWSIKKKIADFSDEYEKDYIDFYFHHDHPFIVAGTIHFQNNADLQQQYSNVASWLKDMEWFSVKEHTEEYRRWRREAGGKS